MLCAFEQTKVINKRNRLYQLNHGALYMWLLLLLLLFSSFMHFLVWIVLFFVRERRKKPTTHTILVRIIAFNVKSTIRVIAIQRLGWQARARVIWATIMLPLSRQTRVELAVWVSEWACVCVWIVNNCYVSWKWDCFRSEQRVAKLFGR